MCSWRLLGGQDGYVWMVLPRDVFDDIPARRQRVVVCMVRTLDNTCVCSCAPASYTRVAAVVGRSEEP